MILGGETHSGMRAAISQAGSLEMNLFHAQHGVGITHADRLTRRKTNTHRNVDFPAADIANCLFQTDFS